MRECVCVCVSEWLSEWVRERGWESLITANGWMLSSLKLLGFIFQLEQMQKTFKRQKYRVWLFSSEMLSRWREREREREWERKCAWNRVRERERESEVFVCGHVIAATATHRGQLFSFFLTKNHLTYSLSLIGTQRQLVSAADQEASCSSKPGFSDFRAIKSEIFIQVASTLASGPSI